MMLLGPSVLGEACACVPERERAYAHERSEGKRGLIFFFTDRVSLSPNFLSLCEQVPPVSSWKVLHSNTLKSNTVNNETKNCPKINRQTVNSD